VTTDQILTLAGIGVAVPTFLFAVWKLADTKCERATKQRIEVKNEQIQLHQQENELGWDDAPASGGSRRYVPARSRGKQPSVVYFSERAAQRRTALSRSPDPRDRAALRRVRPSTPERN
jgi:hypothetical protein